MSLTELFPVNRMPERGQRIDGLTRPATKRATYSPFDINILRRPRQTVNNAPVEFLSRPAYWFSTAAAGGGLLRVLGLGEGAACGVGLVAGAGALVEGDEVFEDGAGAGL
jgi:hypothetical protein